ncbi:ras-associated and pleckstrin homology domains-containing protein 1-like [Myxocyprinus asiaticus]|uniref:ras-associated and pleckstrin homology domains-containing protein 1-like n=1 Tax=Myxocyprinus asiaticus TaxID=70543 RepID=UPI0022236CBC|nr:ras-associated and pleckstrin homology domains-containing protein 1-like [Myxocyprinus asiaticus]
MDLAAIRILLLQQGDRPVEDHAREFLELANVVHYPDRSLVGFFRAGLNSALRELIPLADPHWTLGDYVENALELYLQWIMAVTLGQNLHPRPLSRSLPLPLPLMSMHRSMKTLPQNLSAHTPATVNEPAPTPTTFNELPASPVPEPALPTSAIQRRRKRRKVSIPESPPMPMTTEIIPKSPPMPMTMEFVPESPPMPMTTEVVPESLPMPTTTEVVPESLPMPTEVVPESLPMTTEVISSNVCDHGGYFPFIQDSLS